MKKKTIGLIIFFVAMAAFFLLTMNSGGSGNNSSALQINSVVYADDGSLDVVWNYAEGATGYEIYRADTEDGEFELIGSADSETFVFNDADVEDYNTYYYQVKALMENGEPVIGEVAYGYTQGKLINSNINVEVGWNNGSSFLMETGTDIGCGKQKVNLTIFDGDTPISDYTLYCDEEILKPIRQDNGVTVINPSKRGNYIITVMTEDAVGSVKIVFDEFYTSDLSLSWSGRASDIFSDRIIEPSQQKISYGVIDGNKNPISGYTVTSSDSRTCSVEMVDDRFILTNNSPGTCFINVEYRGQTINYEFLVRGGLATEELNNIEFQSGVSIGKDIEQNKAAEIIKQFTTPQYTSEEIEQMVEESITLEELAEKIKTPADIITLFNVIDYAEHEVDDNCNNFDEEAMVDWGFIWSASKVYENRSGNCGGTSTIVNYLLKDDFTEQGYVEYSNHLGGGHIFNYFKIDDYYIMCDFAGPMDYRAGDIDPKTTQYMVYITDDPQDFGNYYVTHDSAFTEGSNEGFGALLFMYERQGVKLPKGRQCYEDRGNDYWSVLPEQYKDKYILLAERQGLNFEWQYFDERLWPEETKEYEVS